MARLRFDGVGKQYGDVTALDALDLDVGDGEVLCVLGPSGAGKSTALRLAAGLERVSVGRVLIDDTDVTVRPAAQRDISMVFQSYALFPHLDVADNIGFGLAVRKVPAAERARRVARRSPSSSAAAGCSTAGPPSSRAASASAWRWPGRSSGSRPSCCSTSRSRTSTRRSAPTCASSSAGCTTRSARPWSTSPTTNSRRSRSATASRWSATAAWSRLGSPDDLYRRPANRFVATFVGQPRINVLPTTRSADTLHVGPFTLPAGMAPEGDLEGGIRPEHLVLGRYGQR